MLAYAAGDPKKMVLVVEDDPVLLLHTVDLIEEAGFETVEAHNADEAIAILEARSDIAIVFTDVEMPGTMDGIKLAHAVRKRWPPVHLIVASGRYTALTRELPEGSRFFAKPYNEGQLVAALVEFAGREGQPSRPSAS